MYKPLEQAHIFLPLAVFLGASQLALERNGRVEGHYAFLGHGLERESELALERKFQSCMEALRKMQSFNHMARDHLAVLESQEFSFGGF